MQTKKPDIIAAIEHPELFGSLFEDGDWTNWKVVLRAVFGLSMTPAERGIYSRFTARDTVPLAVDEAWLVVGRGGGKSFISAIIAVYMALFCEWDLGIQQGHVMCFASDRRQAQVVMKYIKQILSLPLYSDQVETEKHEEILLKNGINISVITASFRSPRGLAAVAVIADELAYWMSEGSDPAIEVIRALRPCLARVPGSKLLCISAPYNEQGPMFEAYRDHYGKENKDVLVWHSGTRQMNPTFPADKIEQARRSDPVSAACEYDAVFRSDVTGFLDSDAIEGAVGPERQLSYDASNKYYAFVDTSGGRHDEMTLGLSYYDKERGVAQLARLEARKPPFKPAAVTAEYSEIIKEYQIDTVTGDAFGARWPPDEFERCGIKYVKSELTKSELFLEMLAPLMEGSVGLLDNRQLVEQLKSLQRKTGPHGKDSVVKFRGTYDDIANSASGALWLARKKKVIGKSKLHDPRRSERPRMEPTLSTQRKKSQVHIPGGRQSSYETPLFIQASRKREQEKKDKEWRKT